MTFATSHLSYVAFYPAQQLSNFASDCSKGTHSKLHYAWIIPTQIICSLVTIPLCVVAGVIHFLAAVLFGTISKISQEDQERIESSRLESAAGLNNANFETIHRDLRRGLNGLPSSTYSLEQAQSIKQIYNESIKGQSYYFDLSNANLTSCLDSLVFPIRLVGQIFYAPLNANYCGIARNNLLEYAWDPRYSL